MLNEGAGLYRIITHSNWIGDSSWNSRWAEIDFFLQRKVQRGDKFSFQKLNLTTVFEGNGHICVSASPLKQTICIDSWWFYVYWVPTSHNSLTLLPSTPYTFYYPPSLQALGLSLDIACAETAKYNHSFFFFSFCLWVNTPIPCMDGDHYRSDSTQGNVSCWIVSQQSHRWTRDKSLRLSSVAVQEGVPWVKWRQQL